MMGRFALPAVLLAALTCFVVLAADLDRPGTVATAYPNLVNGVLASALLCDLPDGVLLDMGTARITQAQVDEVVSQSSDDLRDQLRRNELYLVQEMATKKLLLRASHEWAAEAEIDVDGKPEPEVIGAYLQARVADISVTEAEVAEFYADNTGMFDGADLDDVRGPLGQFLLKTKRQEATDEHVRTIAGTYGVVISREWLATQAVTARDNPVDAARLSGRPSLVDFGSEGCRPCELMAPMLKELRREYAGRANVLFVHVGDNQVLAARYGIRTIPVQVFFDAEGEEVFRHTGFFAQEEMEEKLADMGVE